MAVKQPGPNLEDTPQRAINTDFISEINPDLVPTIRRYADERALIETIKACEGWWAIGVGPRWNRVVFCWRWQPPETAMLVCWDGPSWDRLRARVEIALGLRDNAQAE